MSLSLLIAVALAPQVSFVAVTDTKTKQSWRPTGEKLAKSVYPELLGWAVDSSESGRRALLFRVETREEPSVKYVYKGLSNSTVSSAVAPEGKGHWMAALVFATGGRAVLPALEYGVATGDWKAIGSYSVATRKSTGKRFFKKVTQSRTPSKAWPEASWTIAVHLNDPKLKDAWRIAAFDKSGKAMTRAGSTTRSGGEAEYWFEGKLGSVGRVEVQTRPYTFHKVKDIRLEPKR